MAEEVLYSVTEGFEGHDGGGNVTITEAKTILSIIEDVGDGYSIFSKPPGGLEPHSGTYSAVRHNSNPGYETQMGLAGPGATIRPHRNNSNTLVDDPGGTVIVSCWRKIIAPTGVGLGQDILWIETQNVEAWTNDVGDVYTDYDFAGCYFAQNGGYAGYQGEYESTGETGTAEDNIWVTIRTGTEWNGDWDTATFYNAFGTVPLDVWLKFEISHKTDGKMSIRVLDDDDTEYINTGWVQGPRGWRVAAGWLRLFTTSQYDEINDVVEMSSAYVDDFSYEIVSEATTSISAKGMDSKARFGRAS